MKRNGANRVVRIAWPAVLCAVLAFGAVRPAPLAAQAQPSPRGDEEPPISSADAVEPAFAEVLAELREQYVLGYQPRPRPPSGTWREVRVRVTGGGFEVRAPDGYLAP